eukprot:scaffold121198_cov48-Phaeocystis_antarctica.AAC.2
MFRRSTVSPSLKPPGSSASSSARPGPTCSLFLASAWRRHDSASPVSSAFATGASDSAAARSKCAAASSSSAAERGPASQAPLKPVSTTARILRADSMFGAALTTLADSALSPSSFHHSGLATSSHASCRSFSKAIAVASAQSSEPTGKRSLASRYRGAASTSCPELSSTAPSRTAGPQPAASGTGRPTARRCGPAPPRPRDPAAAPPHHPPSPFAASLASCETPRAAAKRQGSPGS